MQLGMIGLGRMGANMALRLIRKKHECVDSGRAVRSADSGRILRPRLRFGRRSVDAGSRK
jgi:predicted dinucleotide-binding enzyme